MLVVAVPVCTAVGMLACRVGKLNADCRALVFKHFALNSCKHTVFILHTSCCYLYVSAVGSKLRFNLAIPEHQFLIDVLQVLQCNLIARFVFQLKTNSAEIQAVRVYAKIFCGLLVSAATFLKLHCINLFVAMAEVVCLLSL